MGASGSAVVPEHTASFPQQRGPLRKPTPASSAMVMAAQGRRIAAVPSHMQQFDEAKQPTTTSSTPTAVPAWRTPVRKGTPAAPAMVAAASGERTFASVLYY